MGCTKIILVQTATTQEFRTNIVTVPATIWFGTRDLYCFQFLPTDNLNLFSCTMSDLKLIVLSWYMSISVYSLNNLESMCVAGSIYKLQMNSANDYSANHQH